MRFVVEVTTPNEPWNTYVREGTAGEKVARVMEAIRPEAAYWTTTAEGARGGYLVVNVDDASQIPAILEPLYLTFDCDLKMTPVMTPEDLANAGLDALGQEWG